MSGYSARSFAINHRFPTRLPLTLQRRGIRIRPTRHGVVFIVLVLAMFLGFELIAKVPSQLHTPLMSGSNAISGITLIGAIFAAGQPDQIYLKIFGSLAVAFAMINVVGGFLVTHRMLGMFIKKK